MISEKVNNAKSKLDDKYDQVEEAAEEADERFSQVKDTLERSWNRAKRAGRDAEEKLAEYGKEGWQSFQHYAEKHPVQVIGIALALGIVIGGTLFSSNSKD
jgi:ElaB/YqjD/DUF883 family membrane-anchored ribosome-binding protein